VTLASWSVETVNVTRVAGGGLGGFAGTTVTETAADAVVPPSASAATAVSV
jgi:hypothetical protein